MIGKKNFVKWILIYLTSLLVSSPFLAYVSINQHMVIIVAILMLCVSLTPIVYRSHASTHFLILLLLSFSSGMLTWLAESIRGYLWGSIEPYFIDFFALSFILGVLGYFLDQVTYKKLPITKISIIISLFFFLVIVLIIILLKIYSYEQLPPVIHSPALLGILMGFSLGSILCVFAFEALLPGLSLYAYLAEYIMALVVPASAFFIGYMLITLAFSGFYAFLEHTIQGSFQISQGIIEFNDYLYYSFMTITTLGNANIMPTTILAHWITIAEVVIGIIWMTVILAATLGLVQEKFSSISGKHKRERSQVQKLL